MIFFCSERSGDFSLSQEIGLLFCPKRLGDIFFVLRGWVIFFCPKRFGDFFLSREVG